ncbi:MAG: hypothetical protein OXN92_05840 [Gammaproteobacteria bacterium]|nr:hypothetical protein [Gammaproteobacteria bacterium]
MPIDAREVRERLLDLFPAATIQQFPQVREKMTKVEGIAAVAQHAALTDVREFAATMFGYLHQHVHVFHRIPAHDHLNVPTPFGVDPFTSTTAGQEHHYFYLVPLIYELVLDAPLERHSVTFAWPVKVVVAPDHVRIHFTIMAKKPQAYAADGRVVVNSTQEPTERDLLGEFHLDVGHPLDLNRGIKALWDADVFDAPVVRYKRSRATSLEVMDEAFTVKRDDPQRYAELAGKPLYNTTFTFTGENACIKYFVSDPTQGRLAFRRYSFSTDCVDDVVRQILAAN